MAGEQSPIIINAKVDHESRVGKSDGHLGGARRHHKLAAKERTKEEDQLSPLFAIA